jgi:hypothetical protein
MTVSVAPDRLATAPPRAWALLVMATWLSDSTTRLRVRFPLFRTPPPSAAAPETRPPVIVSPAMEAVTPPLIRKTRL